MTILGLTIGRTSLKDVQEKLGKAEVTRVSRDEESDVSVCYASPAEGTVLVLYSPRLLGWTDSGLLHGTRDGASYWAVDQNLEVVEQAFDVTELQCGHDAWRGRSVVSLLPIAQTDSVAIDPMETTL